VADGTVPAVDAVRWERRLNDLLAAYDVPGAVVAVLHGDEVTELAAGVANLRTGVAVTADTVFQIGSITKVWTTTVAMMLAAEGALDFDVPVRRYLPDFGVADARVSEQVTVRHLVTHTSGIAGDHLVDVGRGDDCLARFVAACADLGQEHPLGQGMSYCNVGFSILGRVIEVITGQVWDQVMRERLFSPLGLARTGTLPEEAILHRAAVGHVAVPGQGVVPAPVWGIPRGSGPAGLIHATAAELLAFARLHLDEGQGPDGAPLLFPAAVKAMQQPHVRVPIPYAGLSWGLGWMLFDWGGRFVFGHDGATLGQGAMLRIVPDARLALALVANGSAAHDLFETLSRELLAELADVQVPELPEPPSGGAGLDLSRYEGRYQRLHVTADVARAEAGAELTATITYGGPLAQLLTPENRVRTLRLTAVDDVLFVVREGAAPPRPMVFGDLDSPHPWLHFDGRLMTKAS
jgi:CubicO group peptidase (beta-lactamase class C family)